MKKINFIFYFSLLLLLTATGCVTTTGGNGGKVLLNRGDYQAPLSAVGSKSAIESRISPFEQVIIEKMEKQTAILDRLANTLAEEKLTALPEPIMTIEPGRITEEDLMAEEAPPSKVPVISEPTKKIVEYRHDSSLNERVARLEGLVAHHHGETDADVPAKFSSGKSKLSKPAKKYLSGIAEKFHRGEILTVDEIIGYADSSKPVGEKTNAGIGLERAKAVADYLAEKGIDISQTKISYGGETGRQTVIVYTKKKE